MDTDIGKHLDSVVESWSSLVAFILLEKVRPFAESAEWCWRLKMEEDKRNSYHGEGEVN